MRGDEFGRIEEYYRVVQELCKMHPTLQVEVQELEKLVKRYTISEVAKCVKVISKDDFFKRTSTTRENYVTEKSVPQPRSPNGPLKSHVTQLKLTPLSTVNRHLCTPSN